MRQALAWRMRHQGLDPLASAPAVDVVRRLVAVRGWPADLPELAVAARSAAPERSAVDRALADGDLVRAYAFSGGSYVFTPQDAATLLTVHTTSRTWATARFQRQGGFRIDDWQPFRAAIREVLDAGPRTRDEIADHLARDPALRHLEVAARTGAGSDSLYKPLHWWGDLCFGPTRDGRATFRLLSVDARRPGPVDLDDAGRAAVTGFLGAYGPATPQNLDHWLNAGLGAPRRTVHTWLTGLGGAVTAVDVDGTEALALTSDVDALRAAEPSDAVRLLPRFDPWVMGPGTSDTRLIAAPRRGSATRGANLVVRGGVVCGTWRPTGRTLAVDWFGEAGRVPTAALEDDARRLAGVLAREVARLDVVEV